MVVADILEDLRIYGESLTVRGLRTVQPRVDRHFELINCLVDINLTIDNLTIELEKLVAIQTLPNFRSMLNWAEDWFDATPTTVIGTSLFAQWAPENTMGS